MQLSRRGLKVFFVEDNPHDVELASYELTKGGFDVVSEAARNKSEFLAKLPGIDADILITDYSLPDITGIEAIRICREKKIDIPIIFITGAGDEMIAVDSLREGASDYILKKNIAGLPARVSRVLDIWAERKAKLNAEAEKQKLQELLFQSQKMESVGRLASGIAHDFTNIITGIMGFAEIVLQDTSESSPTYRDLQAIIALCERSTAFTKQLLAFGKKIKPELSRININLFIEEFLNFLRYSAGKEITVRLNLQKGISEINADSGQLSQVLMNLALNARDSMDGCGVLEIKTEQCSATSPDGIRGEYICLSVSDTGCGISENNITQIFDPFFTTKAFDKGTGLGLAIVYSTVNAHGGWIDVNSKLGKGTTFKIFLPAAHAETSYSQLWTYEPVHKDSSRIKGGETVLIADDEDTIRAMLASGLRNLGYNVLPAKNGSEALDIYRTKPGKINIVVSDLFMPDKNGVDLFKDLSLINPEVKFILITGGNLDEMDQNILGQMDAVLRKPCTPKKVAGLMREILEEK